MAEGVAGGGCREGVVSDGVGVDYSGAVFLEVDVAAVAVHQGIAQVGRVGDDRGVFDDPHGEGGMPAEAKRAVNGCCVVVGFVFRGVDPQDGAVAAVSALPRHRDAASGYFQINFTGEVGTGNRVQLVGKSRTGGDQAEDYECEDSSYMVHGIVISSRVRGNTTGYFVKCVGATPVGCPRM